VFFRAVKLKIIKMKKRRVINNRIILN